jgi:hypothetical protein
VSCRSARGSPAPVRQPERDRLLGERIPQNSERLNEPNRRAPSLGLLWPRAPRANPEAPTGTGR